MIETAELDVFDVNGNENVVIMHPVNCLGVPSRFGEKLSERFNGWESDYRKTCVFKKDSPTDLLGNFTSFDAGKNIIILNCFVQAGLTGGKNGLQDLNAWAKILRLVEHEVGARRPAWKIRVPADEVHGRGKLHDLLRYYFEKSPVNLTICERNINEQRR